MTRAVFFGTPEIAVPALAALADSVHVVGVVCQPDRPAGRGLNLKAPALKVRARALGLEVVQPEKLRGEEFAAWLRARDADVGVVMAYGRMLPEAVLSLPRLGCINLHASLLPKYRGAAPISWAIVHGERETGIALMQMDAGCDTGPTYTSRALEIGADETAGELSLRLAALGAIVVREDLPRALEGELACTAQDATRATMARLLERADGEIDWRLPAGRVHDRVRGMTPWPGAQTTLNGGRFKVLVTRVASAGGNEGEPGVVLSLDGGTARIACGDGALWLLRGQAEGRKALDARELASGRTIAVGMRFVAKPPGDA
ncbi:MAG: methionyl-tRNA formyltransferase [Myxococcales bacterium]|nr:methionyl-tRNA formyltransferase [Myxococcales bacterium]